LITSLSYAMYDDMTARINARLDDDLAAQLEQTRKLTGKSTSAILKDALKLYFARDQPAKKRPYEIMQEMGFIGCGKGEPNLSTDYKKILAESWTRSIERKL